MKEQIKGATSLLRDFLDRDTLRLIELLDTLPNEDAKKKIEFLEVSFLKWLLHEIALPMHALKAAATIRELIIEKEMHASTGRGIH